MAQVQPPLAEGRLFTAKNSLRLFILCCAVMVHAVNTYLVNTIMPVAVGELGGQAYYAWTASFYIAASIIGAAIGSCFIRALGLRAALLFALLLFIMGTMGAAMSPTPFTLLVARTIQGLGGGLILGLSFVGVYKLFLPSVWTRAIAVLSTVWVLSLFIGPLLGAVFVHNDQWRLAFWATVPVAMLLALVVLFALRSRPESRTLTLRRAPLFKVLALTLAVLLLSYANMVRSGMFIALYVVIVVSILYGLGREDLTRRYPMFPSGAFFIHQPLGSLYLIVGLLSLSLSSLMFMPYFLHTLLDLALLEAGYIGSFVIVGWLLAWVFILLTQRATGTGGFIMGPLWMALSLWLFAVLVALPTMQQLPQFRVWLYASLFGLGFGAGLMWPALLRRVQAHSKNDEQPWALMTITNLQLYAMALGVAASGVITTTAGIAGGSPADLQRAALWLFGLFGCAPLLFLFFSKGARTV